MIDHTYAFADKASAIKGLAALGFITVTKGEIAAVQGVEIDWSPITVVRVPAIYDEKTGQEITPAEVDARYFVNVRMSDEKAADESRPAVEGKEATIYDATISGAQFKTGQTKDDYVASKVITLDGVDCELIDPASWPDGPPRVWQ